MTKRRASTRPPKTPADHVRGPAEAAGADDARYRELFENSVEGLFQSSPQGRYLRANAEFARLFGYESPTALLEEVNDIGRQMYVDLKDRIEIMRRVNADGAVRNYEAQVRRRDGTTFWLKINVRAVRDANNALLFYEGAAEDITAAKRATDLLVWQRNLALQLTESSGLDETLKLCLRAAIEIAGMDCGALYLRESSTGGLRLACHEGLSPEFVAAVLSYGPETPQARMVESKTVGYGSFESMMHALRIAHLQGEGLRAMAVVPIRRQATAIGALVVTSHELPTIPEESRPNLEAAAEQMGVAIARDLALNALLEREERYRATFEQAIVGMVHLSLDGRFLRVNRRLCDILGYEPAELLQMPLLALAPPEEPSRHAEVLPRLIAGEIASHDGERRCRRKDGSIVWLHIAIVLLRDSRGRPDYFVAVVNDISDRKRAEETMRRRAELDALTTSLLARFVGCPLEDVDAAVVSALREVACFIGGDSASVLLSAPDKTYWISTHEWRAASVPPRRRDLSHVPFGSMPWSEKTVLSNQVMRFSRLDDLPPEAEADRRLFRELGVVSMASVPVFGSSGGIAGCLAVHSHSQPLVWTPEDINCLRTLGSGVFGVLERKRTEEALRRSERNYREIFNAAADALFIQDENGRVLDVNDRACLMYRCERAKALAPETVAEADTETGYSPQRMVEHVRRAVTEGPQVFEWLNRRFDGELFWAEVSLQACEIAGERRVLASVRDITDRKRTEEALRQNEAMFRSMLQATPAGVALLVDREVKRVNAALCQMTGYSEAEVLGNTTRIYYPSDEEYERVGRTLYEDLRRHGLGVAEAQLQRKDGPLIDVILHLSPFEPGNPDAGVTATVLDITERKRSEQERARLQEQLQQAMKMEAVGRLAGGIAHDFNNLLTGIAGNIELAQLEARADSLSASALQEARRATDSASALTRRLLAFSRKQIIEPRLVNLNDLVDSMHKMLARVIGEDVSLKIVKAEALGAVRIDPGQFEQALVNLAVNARDAMPTGGQLLIETANVELDEAYCASRPNLQPGRYVRLTVSDTGHGMSHDVKARLFEPFFTTKPMGRGTGLGLASIYGGVRQAGGSIEVYSELDVGTIFKIYLPRTDAAADDLAHEAHTPELPHGTETILVVEDEDVVRLLAERVLSRLGYAVHTAGSGEEALEWVQTDPRRIDLLVTDVVMPGMNGRQLAEFLHATHPQTKVLYTSGYTEDVIVHHGVVDGELNFLSKPYTLADLAEKVRAALDG